jgi:hypothetical protein
MDFFIEIILGGLIANTLGLYTRYFFFKVIGKEKSIKHLSGKGKDDMANVSQNMANTIVGLIVFIPLGFGIVYVIFSIF